MAKTPYSSQQKHHFWKSGVTQSSPFHLENINKNKFSITHSTKIATAGSCFAQHITNNLKLNNYKLIDNEPPPPGLKQSLHSAYGYNLYSARYGNIYTVKQLAQLSEECVSTPIIDIQEVDKRFYDMLRPSVQPDGFQTYDETVDQRHHHIKQTRQVFEEMDVFIFTLGLTECWINSTTNTVYPSAPGTRAGHHDEKSHYFHDCGIDEMKLDFKKFHSNIYKLRNKKDFHILFTVSPVPLTATASEQHVLVANTFSKAKLRALAGELCSDPNIDYFPSYEIITNPRLHSASYCDNLRNVRPEAVQTVLEHFNSCFDLRPDLNKNLQPSPPPSENLQCEEALLEAFGNS